MVIQKKVVIFLILALAMVQICLAEDMTVHMQLLEDYNTSLIFTVSTTGENGETTNIFEEATNNRKEISYTFSCPESRVNLYASARMAGYVINTKKEKEVSCGGTYELNLFNITKPSEVASSTGITGQVIASNPIVNSTVNSTMNMSSNQTATQLEDTSKQESFVFSSSMKSGIKIVAYILGGLIILVIIFIIIKMIYKKFYKENYSFKKSEDVVVLSRKADEELQEAQRKIKQDSLALDFLKDKKQKLLDAQKRLDEAKKDLRDLS